MKLVKQSYEILEQEIPVRKMDDYSGSHFREEYMNNMYKHIERCGRICYKSEDKITEDSAKRFVEGLIKSKHLSVLEHGVVYLKIFGKDICNKYLNNKYSKVHYTEDDCGCITTNYRVIIENHWEKDLEYQNLCEPNGYHELRHTVLLHGCIHTYKDLTRHRKMSFSIESTRYCNYSKTDKFGEMKFVKVPWIDYDKEYPESFLAPNTNEVNSQAKFIHNLKRVEKDYNELISLGWQPQQAAEILPQCTAADIVMSGFDCDWDFVFNLRALGTTGKPHPLVLEIMKPLRDEFVNNGWILPFKV